VETIAVVGSKTQFDEFSYEYDHKLRVQTPPPALAISSMGYGRNEHTGHFKKANLLEFQSFCNKLLGNIKSPVIINSIETA